MTRVQEYLLMLIKEIDDICTENDIDYYIFAGSMLGVERNEGFLPWDDDIDLIMTEENYQKFIKIMRENPVENRIFECREDNEEYPLQFGKYMSTDMTGLIRPHAFGSASSGLWIDIVRAVPAPVSNRRIDFIKKWFSCYCEIDNEIYLEFYNHYEGFYWRYKICQFLVSVFGKKRVDKWAKKLFNSYPEETCEKYLMYHCLYTDYRFFDKKFFEKPVRRKYEGMELSVCPYNREFSRVLFGDSWMMVPKVDERATHTMVVDFDVPYHKYVDDYMCFLDKDEVLADIKKNKSLMIKHLLSRKKYVKRSFALRGMLLNEKMKSIVQKQGLDLNKMLVEGKKTFLDEFYAEYEGLQFDEVVSFWKAFIPLDDDILYPYLNKCLRYDGQYYKTNKLLGIRETSAGSPLSEELKSLKPVIDICRSLSVALWDDQNMEEVERIIKEKIEGRNYGFCIDFELAKLYLKFSKAVSVDDYDEIKGDIDTVLDLLPEQGECIKLLGDIEYALGRHEAAMSYYDKAEGSTSNGLLLLDIRKKKEAHRNEHL